VFLHPLEGIVVIARRTAVLLVTLIGVAANVQAQAPKQPPPPKLYSGMGTLHHPIATTNPEAQKFFDQGMTLLFGFNHEEAARSFKRAAELDPKSPMPLWGVALALGPNYNMDVDVDRELAAHDAVQKADELAGGAPENERAYVAALAHRYSNDPKPDLPKLSLAYANAMRDLAHRHPDDPDAQVLFAESLMDLHPWQLWTLDGKPGENTEEIISTLEAVLRRWPDHPGANHYYIHAVEASPTPERALPSSKRLETLVPAAGHLVHMPAHIYIRTGDYTSAARVNQEAVARDIAFVQTSGVTESIYGFMYLSHNLDFLRFAAAMNGQFAIARDAANKVADMARPAIAQMPMLEVSLPSPMMVLVRFAKWDEVLALPAPDSSLAGATMMWHFARTCAFAAKGQTAQAETERAAYQQIAAHLPPGPAYGILFNDWSVQIALGTNSLDARIAQSKGDTAAAIASWRKAVEVQDHMKYDEPPEWYYPIRESLGAALLRLGNGAEAESVFREDLKRNPNNPRSLFGIWKSLDAQKKTAEAQKARQVFEAAWKNADTQLRLEDF
jgi:tetratricopeptide (TPR) repeat protein